ncbi:hypothetical protein LCGC14_1456180 [marine sediment metagenome]|uniref:Uncharacterized protein n=1 Tax=marine sediment metagenome TaxID=412755 RepID=A0A0F9JH64_9ZZZZ
MIIGIIHVNRKKGRPGQCKRCKETIGVGKAHVVVIVRYGKAQEANFKMKAAQGQAWTKKAGLKYRRLHLKDCLSEWLSFTYLQRTEARREHKGGRPPLPDMSPEEKLTRHRLVRRRAEIIRQIDATDDNIRIVVLADRLLEIQNQMEVPVTPPLKKNMHRKMILSKVQGKINTAKEATNGALLHPTA